MSPIRTHYPVSVEHDAPYVTTDCVRLLVNASVLYPIGHVLACFQALTDEELYSPCRHLSYSPGEVGRIRKGSFTRISEPQEDRRQ